MTPKQKRVYDYITSVIKRGEICPSYAEIMKALNISSKSIVAHYLNMLEKDGQMKKIILSFLLVLTFTCQKIKSDNIYLYRCENDEIICYVQNDGFGYGRIGGLFCKFKDERKVEGDKND